MKRVAETGREYISGNNQNIVNAADSQSISFSTNYDNPVVVAHTATNSGGQPVDDRVTDVSSNSFTLFAHEPDNEGHADNTHTYIACEQGVWNTPEENVIEAGIHQTETTTRSGESFDGDYVEFDHNWSSAPVIISSVNTHNNGTFSTVAIKNVTTNGFEISQLTENGQPTEIEKIGWIAFPQGSSTLDGNEFEAGLQASTSVSWASGFSSKPDYVADLNEYTGSDPRWVRGSGTWSSTDGSWYIESGSGTGGYGYVAIEELSTINARPAQGDGTGDLNYEKLDFIGGLLGSQWTNVDTLGTTTSRVYTGNYAGRNNSNPSGNVLATFKPDELSTPSEIDSFVVYYQETSSQTGHAFNIYDKNDNRVLSFGSENPQFWIRDGNGEKYRPGNASSIDAYNIWLKVVVRFDWANGTYSLTFSRPPDGTSDTFTGDLRYSTNVNYINIAQNVPGTGRGGSANDLWIDNIGIDTAEGYSTSTSSVGGTYSGPSDNNASVEEHPTASGSTAFTIQSSVSTSTTESATKESVTALNVTGNVAAASNVVANVSQIESATFGAESTAANSEVIISDGILGSPLRAGAFNTAIAASIIENCNVAVKISSESANATSNASKNTIGANSSEATVKTTSNSISTSEFSVDTKSATSVTKSYGAEKEKFTSNISKASAETNSSGGLVLNSDGITANAKPSTKVSSSGISQASTSVRSSKETTLLTDGGVVTSSGSISTGKSSTKLFSAGVTSEASSSDIEGSSKVVSSVSKQTASATPSVCNPVVIRIGGGTSTANLIPSTSVEFTNSTASGSETFESSSIISKPVNKTGAVADVISVESQTDSSTFSESVSSSIKNASVSVAESKSEIVANASTALAQTEDKTGNVSTFVSVSGDIAGAGSAKNNVNISTGATSLVVTEGIYAISTNTTSQTTTLGSSNKPIFELSSIANSKLSTLSIAIKQNVSISTKTANGNSSSLSSSVEEAGFVTSASVGYAKTIESKVVDAQTSTNTTNESTDTLSESLVSSAEIVDVEAIPETTVNSVTDVSSADVEANSGAVDSNAGSSSITPVNVTEINTKTKIIASAPKTEVNSFVHSITDSNAVSSGLTTANITNKTAFVETKSDSTSAKQTVSTSIQSSVKADANSKSVIEAEANGIEVFPLIPASKQHVESDSNVGDGASKVTAKGVGSSTSKNSTSFEVKTSTVSIGLKDSAKANTSVGKGNTNVVGIGLAEESYPASRGRIDPDTASISTSTTAQAETASSQADPTSASSSSSIVESNATSGVAYIMPLQEKQQLVVSLDSVESKSDVGVEIVESKTDVEINNV